VTGAALPLVVSGTVAALAIAGSTVAVCLGHIDASTFAAIVGGVTGASVGVGAHAAGTRA
jgi:hypothetical protein